MEGVEAVIDKDRTSALLARDLEEDVLLMLTDGGPSSAIGVDELTFADGSMGPKITAASDFVWAGGVMAGIGRLQDARAIVVRRAAVRPSRGLRRTPPPASMPASLPVSAHSGLSR